MATSSASGCPYSRTEATLKTDSFRSCTNCDKLRDALIEADTYLAALGWWEIGNIAKAGEVIGDAIGWDRVAVINAEVAPKPGGLLLALKGK